MNNQHDVREACVNAPRPLWGLSIFDQRNELGWTPAYSEYCDWVQLRREQRDDRIRDFFCCLMNDLLYPLRYPEIWWGRKFAHWKHTGEDSAYIPS
jgi:hypothetical protein